MNEARPTWREAVAQFMQWPVLRIGLLGFSSGLPLLLVFGTLSFWLREAGIDRTTIGFISWIALAYAFKVLWAPFVDRISLPVLTRYVGHRRAWLLLTQVLLALGLSAMALTDPAENLSLLVWLALLVAATSATQDVVFDAYRIESADVRMQGIMAAAATTGYRVGMFAAGAGAFWIAGAVDMNEATYEQYPWAVTYFAMAALMSVGFVTTLLSAEPQVKRKLALNLPSDASVKKRIQAWLWQAVIQPFAEFIRRYGWLALLVLALIASYRISDIVLGVIANVFYKDMGFSKEDIALVSKTIGLTLTIIGGLLGGLAVYRFGVMRMLMIGALLAASTNLLFALLATSEPGFSLFVVVVGLDNLSAGLASAAFVAYLSGLVNVSYSATQYALFSSMMLLLPKFLGGFSGLMVDSVGYPTFFVLTALMGVPVLLLVLAAWRYTDVELPTRG
jgi:PAT family beta-lactamase induction signal transducer AmpG